MLLDTHTDPDGTADDRFAEFSASIRKAARSPRARSLAPLATQERPHSPESQMYIPDGCTHVAGDPAYW